MPVSAGSRVAPPAYLIDTESWKRLVAAWMREANQGHLSNTGTFSCTSGTAQTVLVDSRIGFASCIGFSPTTANAAAELATLYVSDRSAGGATIAHANAATGDRTFTYSILG